MENDFVKELGYLGFTMRLKRISDTLMHEGRRLYSELDVDIEPNWFVVFKLLQSRGAMTVTQIAECVMMAHPSVITITNKMLNAGYLVSEKDPEDSRKRLLDLSDRAEKMLPKYEKIWDAGELGIEKALQGLDPLLFITEMENRFAQSNFKQRTLKELKS
ncbi:MarR family transcriptional regulator [bacterium SCSIO 12643]|nr:MarR family transcriptional regulator [bacterium SCSIO 12643]